MNWIWAILGAVLVYVVAEILDQFTENVPFKILLMSFMGVVTVLLIVILEKL